MLIAGIVLLILGVILSVIPVTSSAHVTTSNFGGSLGQWFFSSPIHVPGGVRITLSWNSNQDVTIGLATQAAVNAFRSGATSSPDLLSSGSGRVSSFSVTVPQTGDYILAGRLAPFSGTWTISVDITTTAPFGFAIFGVPILIVGIILLILGAALKAKAPVPVPPAVAHTGYQQTPPAQGVQRVLYQQPFQPQQPAFPHAPVNPPAPSYQPSPVNPPAPQVPQPTPGAGTQVAKSFCVKCGAPLPMGAAFCGACGAKIG